MIELRIVPAQVDDLANYLNLLEEIAAWLEGRGINQWRPGGFRLASSYYEESIRKGEVQLAFMGQELVGSLRLLFREPVVWPDVAVDDALYVYNLAVKRTWRDHRLGSQMLEWAGDRATSLGRFYLRLDCMAATNFSLSTMSGLDSTSVVKSTRHIPLQSERCVSGAMRSDLSSNQQLLGDGLQPAAVDAILSRRG